MPQITKAQRMQGGHTPAPTDTRPTLPRPDQSRYGTATTDPLGREGPGWHKGKQTGLPTRTKGDETT